MIDKIKAVKTGANTGITAVNFIINATGKQSLNRMAKDSIFQFPSIISSAIDTEEAGVILKSTEQVYASMMLSVLSLQGSIDRSKYGDTITFLKKFHTNDLGLRRSAESTIPDTFEIGDATIATEGACAYSDALIKSLWEDVLESQFDMESLNDMYRPFEKTKKKLEDRLLMATEASAKVNNAMNDAELGKYPKLRDAVVTAARAMDKSEKYDFTTPVNSNSRTAGGDAGYAASVTNKQNNDKSFKPLDIKQANNPIMKVDRLANMEPTMLTVTLVNYNESANWTQQIVLGIKTMPRIVKSSVMVESMMDAAKDKAIFRFIKWTKGELKLHQVLCGALLGNAKATGVKAGKGEWLAQLKKRKAINAVSKFLDRRLLPNCTIIITEAECEQIKERCGVDLHDSRQAKALIDKYFLLGFGIYDTESKIYDVIYDADNSFASYPMRALASQVKKEINNANR